MTEFLLFEQDGPVVILTMNHPEKRNALSGKYQVDNFERACRRVNEDTSVKVVILTGAGKTFSAGGDIFAMRDKYASLPTIQAALQTSFAAFLDGGAKIVAVNGDRLYIKSNVASSVDAVVSVVDAIST